MILWYGLTAIQFSAGGYDAVMVPSSGANLIRLYHTPTGTDILHTPRQEDMALFAEKPQLFGLPLLFPPNRIADGKFSYQGVTYQFPITLPDENNFLHGLLKGLPFVVTRAEESTDKAGREKVVVEAAFFSNRINDQFWRYFPHDFECRMTFELSADGLKQTVTFTNLGATDMPLGVGYHTAFNMPFDSAGRREDYRVQVAVGKRWELSADRHLPTSKLLELTYEEQKMRGAGMYPFGDIMDASFTNKPIKIDGKEYTGAVITDTRTGRRVFYEVDGRINDWTLWNNGNSVPWACIEPQTWTINAPNLALPASVTGFQTLKPGASWSTTARIYVK